MSLKSLLVRAGSGVFLLISAMPVSAEIVLSQLVLELGQGEGRRQDIEVRNLDKERAYVVVDPQEVVNPGTPAEQRIRERDPEKLGLLVSPARMVLEPGQSRLLRVALTGTPGDKERVYRITVKPTTGNISADVSGLKILIGYEVLVLVRSGQSKPQLVGVRHGRTLTIRNNGTGSVELADGKQCVAQDRCQPIPGKRLYAGAEWKWTLPIEGPADFMVLSPSGNARQAF